MKTVWTAVLFTLSLPAAAGEKTAHPQQAEAEAVATELLGSLKKALLKELGKGVPEAITVCRDLAPKLAGDASRKHGWQVRRVGTRVRNPLLGMPDPWEQRVMADFEKKITGGASPKGMKFTEVVTEPNGSYLRHLTAIGTGDLCLACHGGKIAPEIQAALKEHYPRDEATGYQKGQLRGAVSIKIPLKNP